MTRINNNRTIAEALYLDAIYGMVVLSVLSSTILIIRIISTGKLHFAFLVWNLILAWIPALIAWKIVHFASKKLKPTVIIWLTLWVVFLPNTFYILSDFIHLGADYGVSKLFDSVLLFSFSLTGLLLGLGSLGIVHAWIGRYVKPRTGWVFVVGVVLASSFAIYLGRYLRWNSWDIALNPLGLLFDVSDRVINPGAHPATFTTTLLFFGFIMTTYLAFRNFVVTVWRRIQS